MKTFLISSLVVNTLLLLGCLTLLVGGSQEAFPTEEQTNSARVVWGSLTGLFLLIEISLLILLRRTKR